MVADSGSSVFLDHLARRGAGSIHPMGRRGTEILLQSLDLQERESVLELGCGTGETLVRMAADRVDRVFGLDISKMMVECARRRCAFCQVQERVTIQQVFEGTQWPFETGVLDAVIAESVMAILDSGTRRYVLGEVSRILKPGGRFLFSDSLWKQGVQREIIVRHNERCLEDFGLAQATADWVGLEACRKELRRSGFELVYEGVLAGLPVGTEALPRAVKMARHRSRLFTLRSRIQAMLSPAFWVRELRFRRAMLRHRETGRLIESWLIIARRI